MLEYFYSKNICNCEKNSGSELSFAFFNVLYLLINKFYWLQNLVKKKYKSVSKS